MEEASSLQWNGDYAPEGSCAEGAEQVSERSEESCESDWSARALWCVRRVG
jgi:hypothetical protein